jgi:hypothetical protein
VNKVPGLNVGYVIAFLCPGLVGAVALSYHFPVLGSLIEHAQQSNQSLGVFLFTAVFALAVGVVLSGVRAIVLDGRIYAWIEKHRGIPRPTHDFRHLLDPEAHAATVVIVDAYFRYYQFYANMLVAVGWLSISRLLAGTCDEWPWWWGGLAAVTMIALLLSAGASLRRYAESFKSIQTSQGG